MLPGVFPQALSRQRAEAAAFDSSRLVDFAERVRCAGPAAQLSPLVRTSPLLSTHSLSLQARMQRR